MKKTDSGLYVQYGCGFDAPREWINFDASPTLRFERVPLLGSLYTRNNRRFPANVHYGDVVLGLPVASGSCQGVFASHVLEHLSLEDLRQSLTETFRILQPGGVFRFVFPDLEFLARSYLASEKTDAALEFMRWSGLGRETRPRGVAGLLKAWLGNSEHYWLWDFKSMSAELAATGFTAIRRCAYLDNPDPMFRLVESEGRFLNCLAMEAVRAKE